MQLAKQVSVSLVNKPGRLSDMLNSLNKEKINFRALVVMDSGDRGTVRFVPDDYEAATKLLKQMNLRYESSDVLLVEVPNQPGGFRKICERLADEHLNIDYAYCAFGPNNGAKGGPLAVIRVNDLNKAQRVLSDGGTSRKKLPGRRPVHAR